MLGRCGTLYGPRRVAASKLYDGRPIEGFETYSYCVALASAGHDTTSAAIAGGLLALIEHP